MLKKGAYYTGPGIIKAQAVQQVVVPIGHGVYVDETALDLKPLVWRKNPQRGEVYLSDGGDGGPFCVVEQVNDSHVVIRTLFDDTPSKTYDFSRERFDDTAWEPCPDRAWDSNLKEVKPGDYLVKADKVVGQVKKVENGKVHMTHNKAWSQRFVRTECNVKPPEADEHTVYLWKDKPVIVTRLGGGWLRLTGPDSFVADIRENKFWADVQGTASGIWDYHLKRIVIGDMIVGGGRVDNLGPDIIDVGGYMYSQADVIDRKIVVRDRKSFLSLHVGDVFYKANGEKCIKLKGSRFYIVERDHNDSYIGSPMVVV